MTATLRGGGLLDIVGSADAVQISSIAAEKPSCFAGDESKGSDASDQNPLRKTDLTCLLIEHIKNILSEEKQGIFCAAGKRAP
jgi:hypothetical protein